MKQLNLIFRFILELLVLVGLFLWAFSVSDSLPIQLLLAVGSVIAIMAVWGTFVAPRATRRLPDPPRLVVELIVWTIGVLALGLAVDWLVAAMFGLAVFISLGLMFYWGQRGF